LTDQSDLKQTPEQEPDLERPAQDEQAEVSNAATVPDESSADATTSDAAASDATTSDVAASEDTAEEPADAAAEGEDAPRPEDGRIRELEEKIEELKGQLLRVHADFDNFRKRTRQEKEDLVKYAAKNVIVDLLAVVDNFDRALSALPDEEAYRDVRTGVEMVHRQLLSVLEKHGVQPMDVVGKPFDPALHEAVMQEPADGKEAGIVVQELQKGYTIHGKVLRPAMVKVTV
jgi:molecular chaperone GrpE